MFEVKPKQVVRPIKTDADYEAALEEIWRLWDAEPDTPEGERMMALVTLVEAYEEEHYPIPPPDPSAAIEYYIESRRGKTSEQFETLDDYLAEQLQDSDFRIEHYKEISNDP